MPTVSVSSVTEQEIVSANPYRFELWIKNAGTVDVYLNTGSAATTGEFYLSQGESLIISNERPVKCSIRGIAVSGTGSIKYTEFSSRI